MSTFYDKKGALISMTEWGQLLEQEGYKRVAETYVGE